MLSQREAVYKATMDVLDSKLIKFPPGTDIKTIVSPSMKDRVVSTVVEMFKKGEVEFKDNESNAAKLSDPKKLRQYVVGLVANWFAKDPNLNGGVKKESTPKAAKTGDDKLNQLITLKGLLKSQGKDTKEVEEEITARKAELAPPKVVKKPPVDVSLIPEEFKDLLE